MLKNKYTLITLISLMLVTLAFGQWGPDVRLTNDPNTSFLIYNNGHAVASSGANVHVVWHDNRDGNYEVYYKRSLDNGTTWGSDTRLTNATGYSQYAVVAVSGNSVHVIWRDDRDGDNEIYYKRSLDNGTTWGPDTRLTYNASSSVYPSVAVFDSMVHVVWHDNRDGVYQVYYKHSLDNGITWGADTRLNVTSAWSGFASVAAFDSIVHVAWRDQRLGSSNNEIFYRRSLDNGTTWLTDTNLTNNPSSSMEPCVAVSGSNVHVMFYDNRDGNGEIYYKRSLDNGANWGADTRLTDYAGTSTRPSVGVYNTNVHVAWFEYRDGTTNEEVYYKRSLDNGTTWSADTNLTNNPEYQGIPSLAVSGNNAHVVWMDDRHGNDEIYYKQYLGSAPSYYTITATAYGPGTIVPSGSVMVNTGEDTTFIIAPNVNCQVDSLVVDNINHGADSTYYTFTNVTANHTIKAYFSPVVACEEPDNNYPVIRLQNIYPNPFKSQTIIRYQLSKLAQVNVKIYNCLGREMRTLVNQNQSAGHYSINWDGRDNNGIRVANGIYLCNFRTAQQTQDYQIIVIK